MKKVIILLMVILLPHKSTMSSPDKMASYIHHFIVFTNDSVKKESYILCSNNSNLLKSLKRYLARVYSKKVLTLSDSFEDCDYIFIDDGLDDLRLSKIKNLQKNKSILLLSMGKRNLNISMIKIRRKLNGKFSFIANLSLMRKHRVTLSPKVLRLAEKIE